MSEVNEARDNKPRSFRLCYRCQRRVDWLEMGKGFRCECQDTKTGVFSCYGFVPIRPVIIKRNDGDARPFPTSTLFSARVHIDREVDEAEMSVRKVKSGLVLMYELPKDAEKTKRKKRKADK